MAYGDNYTSDVFTNFLQKRGASGRFPTARESAGMFAPVLDYNLRRGQMLADQQERRRITDRQLALQEQAYADQKKANRTSGFLQLANLPIQGALGYWVLKKAGLLGAANAVPMAPAGAGLGPGGIPMQSAAGTGYEGAGGFLGTAGAGAALYGAQLASSPYVQELANQAGMPHAGRGWKYGGVPGAMAGGAYDIGKKIVDKVVDFVGGLF